MRNRLKRLRYALIMVLVLLVFSLLISPTQVKAASFANVGTNGSYDFSGVSLGSIVVPGYRKLGNKFLVSDNVEIYGTQLYVNDLNSTANNSAKVVFKADGTNANNFTFENMSFSVTPVGIPADNTRTLRYLNITLKDALGNEIAVLSKNNYKLGTSVESYSSILGQSSDFAYDYVSSIEVDFQFENQIPGRANSPGELNFESIKIANVTNQPAPTPPTNQAPVLTVGSSYNVYEEEELTFTATSTDDGLPNGNLTYSLVDAPEGATIGGTTGIFNWTPTEAQGGTTVDGKSYSFKVRVSDGELHAEKLVTVQVNDKNKPPTFTLIGNKTVDELTELQFTLSATDTDIPVQSLTYSVQDAPEGSTFSNGVFQWTPSESQGPGSFVVTFEVSDGVVKTQETITIDVNEVNLAPVLAPIAPLTIDEGEELVYTFSGTDSDLPLTYTLEYFLGDDALSGMWLGQSSGVFTWIPSEAQGPGTYKFKVILTDGVLRDEQEVTVTVNEVNEAPVLETIGAKTVNEGEELTFTASAQDVDMPANTLTYRLKDAPADATIGETSGVFSWTPGEEDGPDIIKFTVIVSDGELEDEEEIEVTINEVNAAPVLNPIGAQTVNEGEELTFTASATDSDSPTLTYSLRDEPTGATIGETTGVFSWTPGEIFGPDTIKFTVIVSDGQYEDEEEITVTINEVNVAPVLEELDDELAVSEGSLLTFTAKASDVDLPENELMFSLDGAPTGATIDPETGAFTWTPSENQGPGTYAFEVVVTDEDGATDEQEITVTVNEVNVAPVLEELDDELVVNEGSLLTFTAEASDVDLPENELTFSLVDAPVGASIDPETGIFTWTPSEAQGPGTYTFNVVVTDEDGAADEQEIMVTVNEVNTAPILHPINNRTVTAGVLLSLNVTAEDDDLPAPDLVYSLVDAPDGAAIDPSTGQFTWRPTNRQAGVTHTFIVQVSDGQLTAEQELSVKVLAYYAGSNEPELVNQGTNVFINGKLVTIGSVTTSVVDGKQVLTTVVDEDQLSDRLESEADQSIISIPASSNADVVISQLSGTIIEKLQDKSARIEVVTNDASYTIPAKELDLSKTLGEDANWAEVKVNITIEHPSAETIALVNQASSQAGVTASSSPINFTVTIEYGGKIVELTQYTGYVERSIETANSEPITTGVVIDENGSMRHVPTEVAREGSGYRGIINSLTNSTYLLIYNEVEFIDVQNHWAKQAIENMAARLIINGAGDGSFKPDQDITRAEFAAILVRGLGLPAIGDAVGFKDVPANAWYAEVVQAA